LLFFLPLFVVLLKALCPLCRLTLPFLFSASVTLSKFICRLNCVYLAFKQRKNGRKTKKDWRFFSTRPMELLNDINGIVRRNQWNRSTKSMELMGKSAEMKARDRRFSALILAF